MKNIKDKQRLFVMVVVILIILATTQICLNYKFIRKSKNLGQESFNKAYSKELKQLKQEGVIVKEIKKSSDYGMYSLNLTETLRLGDENSGYIFSMIGGVAVDEEDNIYVLETEEGKVSKFDKEGKYLYSFGQKGQGPKELFFATTMRMGNDNNLYVLCSGTHRITEFSLNGEFIKTIPINEMVDLPYSFVIDNNGDFYISYYSIKLNSVIHKHNYKGTLIQSFGKPIPFQKPLDNVEFNLRNTNSYGCLLINKDFNLVFSRSNPYEIDFYTNEGVLFKRLFREDDFMPFPKVEKHGRVISFHVPVSCDYLGVIDNKLLYCADIPKGNIEEKVGAVFEVIDENDQLIITKKIKRNLITLCLHNDDLYVFDKDLFVLYRYKVEIKKMR